MKDYMGAVGGRVMDVVIGIIVVCGLLNLIPWLLLAYFRPDQDIQEQIEQTDKALATVAQILLERMAELSDFAASAAPSMGENPILTVLQAFMSQRNATEGNLDYNRDENGQFYGPTVETQAPPTNDSD